MKIVQECHQALGSEIIVTLKRSDTAKSNDKIFHLIWQEIEQFEKKFSRFLPKSELTKINLSAGREVIVSSDFIDLSQKSIELSAITDGLFNPFILPLLQKSGYAGSWPKVSSQNPELDFSQRQLCQVSSIKFSGKNITIPAICALDFGGIGKGYILDKIAAVIELHGIKDYWLSFGGDIICVGSDEGKSGWSIGIASTIEGDKMIHQIETKGEKFAIATSGITKRKGDKSGISWHHIIDPRTGLPAKSDVATATVVAKSAILADVYAKTLVILGSVQAKKFIKDKGIQMAIIQTKNQKVVKILEESK